MNTDTLAETAIRGTVRLSIEDIQAATQGVFALPLRQAWGVLGAKSYGAAYKYFIERNPDLIAWEKRGPGLRAPIFIPVSEIYRWNGLPAPEFTVVQVVAQVMPDGTLRLPEPAAAA